MKITIVKKGTVTPNRPRTATSSWTIHRRWPKRTNDESSGTHSDSIAPESIERGRSAVPATRGRSLCERAAEVIHATHFYNTPSRRRSDGAVAVH